MGVKNSIQVAEFEKLYYDNKKPFKEKHWEALCRYQERNRIDYFKVLNKGVQFANYVGVIQAGDLTIEILPKTDGKRTRAYNATTSELMPAEQAERECWHNVLLQMLKECRLLNIHHVEEANLNLKSNSILEIYFELFLQQTELLLHEGLVKKYRKESGNRNALKGQLIFSKNIACNLVHKERFFVRYTEYNGLNIYNQLLYKTLLLLSSVIRNPLLTDRVNRLLLDFPEMPDLVVNERTFEQLVYDRKTERYKDALLISKMLLLNYRPDITGGSENVLAILFDMNELWEEYVYRRLVKVAKPDVTVSRQHKKRFWKNHTSGYHKTVRPDIVVTKAGKPFIIDTKWKLLTDNRPADDDLKQMFVYNLLWDAEESLLVYPGVFERSRGSYLHFKLTEHLKEQNNSDFANHCSLYFLSVLNKDGKLAAIEPYEELLNSLGK